MGHWERTNLLRRFIRTIPLVRRELKSWLRIAHTLPEPLRTQAKLSIKNKAFHCIGGSVYAHYPGVNRNLMLRLIVSLQTISDYLDNLCDRLMVTEPSAFRVLHYSFLDALNPYASLQDYYLLYPYSETVYLSRLVQTCQELLTAVPYYEELQPTALKLGTYYCELQTLKHVPQYGEKLLQDWTAQTFGTKLAWNEWAAAAGSTLGLFFLFAVSFKPPPPNMDEMVEAYFPWIQGLHILLDYFIDLEEDRAHGDLNFMSFYSSEHTKYGSLQRFAAESRQRTPSLPYPSFHQTVIQGLIALYGSDRKVQEQGLKKIVEALASDTGAQTMLYLCTLLRNLSFIP
ncbi:MAG: DUF2600 family protein [Firmicutes bacterium]|nr:DUF2600 family protein [Bacillota bacterium]